MHQVWQLHYRTKRTYTNHSHHFLLPNLNFLSNLLVLTPDCIGTTLGAFHGYLATLLVWYWALLVVEGVFLVAPVQVWDRVPIGVPGWFAATLQVCLGRTTGFLLGAVGGWAYSPQYLDPHFDCLVQHSCYWMGKF